MQRFLLLVVAVASLIWWIYRSLIRARRSAPRVAGGGRRDLAASGTMVRDRVCNTFLTRERALTTRIGSEEYFFCSEGCRDSFLASRRS